MYTSPTRKTVIVTGGTRGIGRVLFDHLVAKNEYEIIVTGRTPVSAHALMKAALKEMSRTEETMRTDWYAWSLDLTQQESIDGFVKRLGTRMIHGLINNAAVCRVEHLREGQEAWDEVLRTNLDGTYRLTQALQGRIADGGRIINIASQLGQVGRAGYSAYCASKFGLIGLTHVWAAELGHRGVTVNAVCPGWVETGITDVDLARVAVEQGKEPAAYRAELESRLDMKRLTQPLEVAHLVAFLLSKEGSGMTGRALGMHGPSM